MTFCTIGRELLGYVIRICCLSEIIVVTTVTCVGGIVVIAVMTGCTVVGNGRMCPEQLVIVVVYRECRRCPSGIGCVTRFTGSGQV